MSAPDARQHTTSSLDSMSNLDTVWERLGLAIGHATDEVGATGCTVIRGAEGPFRCAAHLLGRASGTRELATLNADHIADRTDAVLLCGGSAYGLDAAAGVMRWMEERGRGFPVGEGVVPLVPAAVIFDLSPLGRFDARPTADMAYMACSQASGRLVPEGNIGAGTGALVGKAAGVQNATKSGVGCGSAEGRGVVAAVIAVVNAFGDVRDGAGRIIAGARTAGGGFADTERMLRTDTRHDERLAPEFGEIGSPGRRNTTLALVAVNALLTKVELAQLAIASTAAMHRRITPCGTSFDGDVVFAVAPMTGIAAPLATIEALAVAALEQAIERAVRTARGRDGFPGLADLTPLAPAPVTRV